MKLVLGRPSYAWSMCCAWREEYLAGKIVRSPPGMTMNLEKFMAPFQSYDFPIQM